MKTWTFLIIFLSLFLQRNSLQNISSTENKNWENQIRQSIQMSEYEFRKSNQKNEIYEITNRAKNLRASIEQNSFLISSRKEDWQVKYTLESFGRKNLNQKITKDFFVPTKKLSNRLTLKNEKIEIQYTNNPTGIRQDFIINQKPEGAGDIVLTLDIESPFELSATDSMLAHSQNKKLILAYDNLKVFDQSGKTLKAKFKLTGHKLAVHVDDLNARYPLVIDPLTTTPNWSHEQNQANASFGYTIAYVGDVNGDSFGDVLIGAPHYSVTHSNQGAVYVYHGSSAGISTTIRNTLLGSGATVHLGQTVKVLSDINQDGYSELIASAPSDSNGQTNEGRVYIYLCSSVGISITSSWQAEANSASA